MAHEEGTTLSDIIRDYIAQHPEEKTKQIIAGLKQQGVDVSVDLVNKVKYRLKQAAGGSAVKRARRAKRIKARKTSAAPAQGAVTGTQLILNYMKQNRKAKPKEIQAGLAAQGHKVTMSLISAVRARRKARRKAKRMAATAAARTTPASSSLSAAQLVDVKRLADALGGADAVRSALDTLEELR